MAVHCRAPPRPRRRGPSSGRKTRRIVPAQSSADVVMHPRLRASDLVGSPMQFTHLFQQRLEHVVIDSHRARTLLAVGRRSDEPLARAPHPKSGKEPPDRHEARPVCEGPDRLRLPLPRRLVGTSWLEAKNRPYGWFRNPPIASGPACNRPSDGPLSLTSSSKTTAASRRSGRTSKEETSIEPGAFLTVRGTKTSAAAPVTDENIALRGSQPETACPPRWHTPFRFFIALCLSHLLFALRAAIDDPGVDATKRDVG